LWKGEKKLKKIKNVYRPLQPFPSPSFWEDTSSDYSGTENFNLPVERVYQIKRIIKYPDGRVEVREERGVVLKR